MNVTTCILRILENVKPSGLNESVLLSEVRITRGGCGESEFAAALRTLEDVGMLTRRKDALTQDTFYSIEPAGSQRLREGK
jgi:DNA-binding PadR family transcriptional regulator